MWYVNKCYRQKQAQVGQGVFSCGAATLNTERAICIGRGWCKHWAEGLGRASSQALQK